MKNKGLMKTKSTLINYFLVIIGIIILINILFSGMSLRLDMTDDNRFTLSGATKSILKELQQPVTVTAYFSEDLPPDFAKTKKWFKELLEEYRKRSKGKLMYEFKNPLKDKKIEQEANRAGVPHIFINVRQKDEVVQKKAYMGAVIKMAGKSEIIPIVREGVALEHLLSSNIKKLTIEKKPKIGFIQGHGEPVINKLRQVRQSLEVLYDVESVRMNETTNLDQYKTLAIVAPTDSFPASHIQLIDEYLNKGHGVFIALNNVEGDLQQAMGMKNSTGLGAWLNKKGIVLEDQFVVDKNSGNVTVLQQHGPFQLPTQIEFPYIPLIQNFNEQHPITKGLEITIHTFASPLRFKGDTTSLVFTPLAKTSKKSGVQPCPTYFNINKEWGANDFGMSYIPIGGALEGTFAANGTPSKMVVFSDGDFPVEPDNQGGMGQNQVHEDNVNLMVNSIDWLSDETGLVDLRTKGITLRPLDEIEDAKKTILKYLNFLLPILLIVIYGIIRMQRNKNLRIKRMEGYV
jgi:gliding-associated putative ABC transporter substrate-binding component GldG